MYKAFATKFLTPKFQKEWFELTTKIAKYLSGKEAPVYRDVQRFETLMNKASDKLGKLIDKERNDSEFYNEKYSYSANEKFLANLLNTRYGSVGTVFIFKLYQGPYKFEEKIQQSMEYAKGNDKNVLQSLISHIQCIKPVYDAFHKLKELQAKAKVTPEYPVKDRTIEHLRKLFETSFAAEKIPLQLFNMFLERELDLIKRVEHLKKEMMRYQDVISRYYDSKYMDNRILDIDHKALAEKFAKKKTQECLDTFVYKNIHKIGPILDKSNKKRTINLVDMHFSDGTVQGTVCVKYKDRYFETLTQLVFGVSELGNHFERYPTTFHKITIKDELKYAKQSFRWMYDNFQS